MTKYMREPINALTHLAGAVLSVAGLILLVQKGIREEVGMGQLISLIAFGLSMIGLYTTSGVYHMVKAGQNVLLVLKKLDHSMIFVLIAGSYTPILAFALDGSLRTFMLILIWAIAVSGVVFKVFWINAPRWLYTGIYLGMGWLSIVIITRIFQAAGLTGFLLLAAGGISYTIGAVIYGMKKPNISQAFGFHELFHCFVLAGTFLHFMMVYTQIV